MLCEVTSSVGRVLEFPDTFHIWFSQNNLQKGLVFIFYFLNNNLYTGAGRVSFLTKKIEPILTMPVLINLRKVVIHCWFHKLIITFVQIKVIIKI
jgi:hypothetical protein